jgi:5,6,7,8-tetrahydromethanopterin hydro-lyase
MWREILSFFNKTDTEAVMAGEFFIGESLVGDGNEIAHIDLIIGSKSGPAGLAFTQALSHNSDGFSTLLAVVTPNLPAKPDTLLFNKVTIKGAKQAVQMFGPAQAAVARAVMDSVASGVIDKGRANDLCILVGVFIHWQAESDKTITITRQRRSPSSGLSRASRRSTRSCSATRPRGIRSPAVPRADRTGPLTRDSQRGGPLPGRPSSFRDYFTGCGFRCASYCFSSTARGCPAFSIKSSPTMPVRMWS